MSGYLWKYFLEDDVDRFRQLLETASSNARGGGLHHYQKGSAFAHGASIGSPESFGTSPTLATKVRKPLNAPAVALSRADINHRDASGLTILHHAASSTAESGIGFAAALLEHPLTDLYIQDLENGWTALHRAFYFGNINTARLILERDRQDMFGPMSSTSSQHPGGLIKIKDKEGNAPFDLYATTIQDRSLHAEELREWGSENGDVEEMASDDDGDDKDGFTRKDTVKPLISLGGDSVFTFGSNKNNTLGFGDEDDRQNPERITLRRPDHLLRRFYREHIEHKNKEWAAVNFSGGDWTHQTPSSAIPVSSLPTVVRTTPLVIQDMHMSKLHTAILTADPESNLYVCGHGPGGRLGTGNEITRYHLVCIEGGPLAGKKIVTVALGQNHTLAVSSEGEIFSWGSNGFGQLGYSLPKMNVKEEEPVQASPRQIFGPLKREVIVGVAASRIHSVAHTTAALYTFGKNEGQLGIMDSDARSLDMQTTPRRIAAALFSCGIHSVSAIDKATIVLLDNHDVWVFANYGYSKVLFPLDGFANYFLKTSFLTTKYEKTPNRISKICSGGDTICAMSSSGEIFTVAVSKRSEPEKDTASTTNPAKIRSALSQPHCVWSAKKGHMAARDVDVDQDGSIILTTAVGTVWRRVKRAKIKDATASGTGEYKPKDYKFSRIPGLTRVVAVRASAYGAYAAIRQDSDVTRFQIKVAEPSLWTDVAPLLVFYDMADHPRVSEADSLNPELRKTSLSEALLQHVIASDDLERDVADAIRVALAQMDSNYDAEITTTTSDVRIPVHQFILAGRSHLLRHAFEEVLGAGQFSIPEVLSITSNANGIISITVQGVDFLTLFCLVQYCYTDSFVSFWHLARQFPKMAHRYRQIRVELMKLASRLEMKQLETAARQMVSPKRTMNYDIELAVADPSFFASADIIVQLEDDEVRVHSALMCQRCPFFEGLFKGRAAGMWLAGRRELIDDPSDALTVDLKHIKYNIFQLVLRHIYADAGEEIFDQADSEDLNDHFALEELLDVVTEVMSVANELMLDRLSQICQKVVGRYVNIRNVCGLVNAIAPCSVTEFKDAALEYICLNLEAILQSGMLDELDEDLLQELDEIVRRNQLACLPIARSGRAEALLFERYPELAEKLDRSRRAKIDAIMLSNKFADTDGKASTSFRAQSLGDISASPQNQKTRRRSRGSKIEEPESVEATPVLKPKKSTELMFDMSDDEGDLDAAPTSPSPAVDHDVAMGMEDSSPKARSFSRRMETPTKPAVILSDGQSPVRTPTRPWGATPLPTDKLDLKDIMAQTSSDQKSGLSLALSAEAKKDVRPAGSFTARLSQKERKRLQQQSQQSIAQEVGPGSTPGSGTSGSPWQNVASAKSPIRRQETAASTQQQQQHVPPAQHGTRTPSTPQLTMRQTIANKGSASKHMGGAEPHSTDGPQHRSASGSYGSSAVVPTSSPGVQSRPPPRPSATSTSTSAAHSGPALAPRSIRHTPFPQSSPTTSPNQQNSMLAILSQQQAEKDIIRDAISGPKRSLQDIQQEQAFQEWWDQESRRVMEEEARQRREGERAKKREAGGQRGRGKGGRGKGKGKGGDNAAEKGGAKPAKEEGGPAASGAKAVATTAGAGASTTTPGGKGGRAGGGETDNKPKNRGAGKSEPPSSSSTSLSRGGAAGRGGGGGNNNNNNRGGKASQSNRGRGKERAAASIEQGGPVRAPNAAA